MEAGVQIRTRSALDSRPASSKGDLLLSAKVTNRHRDLPLADTFRMADDPGIIGKGYANCVIYPRRSLNRDHSEIGPS
jgi:hypothetical protein